MSNPFDAILAGDMAFICGDAFGEQLIYDRLDGRQVKFNAVVDRYPDEVIDNGPRGTHRRHFEADLPKQTITWTPRVGDTIEVPETRGSSTYLKMKVESLLTQDAGAWRVRLS